MDTNTNLKTRILGPKGERRRFESTSLATEETTVWDIYNRRATEMDRELVRDWNENLNTLLIFVNMFRNGFGCHTDRALFQAALYSAVLTAFIVESMKMLQDDNSESTRDILLIISRQLQNNSHPAFVRAEYEPPRFAVRVNAMFFTSLSCSLITALSAVLALQWVANYDMGLNTSSARKRALQRHIRFSGINQWKMAELIACLPLLIFIALSLFFIGIADWLWHVNRIVSTIVIGAIGIGFILYAMTNAVSIIWIEAPFRTPVSKGSAALIRQGSEWVNSSIANLFQAFLKYETTEGSGWSRYQDFWYNIRRPTTLGSTDFAKCEEAAFDDNERVLVDSLLWLANSIELSPSSRYPLMVLIRSFMDLPAERLMEGRWINNAPWESIFTILCSPYFAKRRSSDYSKEELEESGFLCKAMSMIGSGIRNTSLENFHRSLFDCEDAAIRTSARLACRRHWMPEYPLQGVVRVACECVSKLSPHHLYFILLNIQQSWPKMDEFEKQDVLDQLTHACAVPFSSIHDKSNINTINKNSLLIIFNLVSKLTDERSGENEGSLAERYASTIKSITLSETEIYSLIELHRSIQQQILAQIVRIDLHSVDGVNKFGSLLDLLLKISNSEVTSLKGEEMDSFMSMIIVTYAEFRYKIDDLDKALMDTLQYGYTGPRIERDPWVTLVMNVDCFLARRKDCPKEIYLATIKTVGGLFLHMKVDVNDLGYDTQSILTKVQDPGLALLLSWFYPEDWEFLAITQPDFGRWNENIEQRFFKLWSYPIQNIIVSQSQIGLVRALMTSGPPSARQKVIDILEECQYRAVEEDKVIKPTSYR
jgi:hypothetical protein